MPVLSMLLFRKCNLQFMCKYTTKKYKNNKILKNWLNQFYLLENKIVYNKYTINYKINITLKIYDYLIKYNNFIVNWFLLTGQ